MPAPVDCFEVGLIGKGITGQKNGENLLTYFTPPTRITHYLKLGTTQNKRGRAMLQSYVVPSVEFHDLSRFNFVQTQATCALGTVNLVPYTGNPPLASTCGFRDGASSVSLCLSEAVDPNLLEGLILNLTDGSSVTIAGCVPFDFAPEATCPASYSCSVPLGGLDVVCVNSIECPDGTLIACPNQDECNFG
jgi:hypothetical protein